MTNRKSILRQARQDRKPYKRRYGKNSAAQALAPEQFQLPVQREIDTLTTIPKLQALIKRTQDFGEIRASDRDITVERALLKKGVRLMYDFEACEIQVDILQCIIFDKEDCIVSAKTSMGKSLPIQSAALFMRDTITLIIVPLSKIGEEQCVKIKRIGEQGGNLLTRPVFLDKDSKSKDCTLYDKIRQLKFTHILLSPELAVSDEFQSILTSPAFKARVALVAIDEAHLVAKWGQEFRTAYAQLSYLRTRLGDTGRAPWIACSATLDSCGLSALYSSAYFAADTRRYRASIDRPEISYAFQPIPKNTFCSFNSLAFTVQQAVDSASTPTPWAIPKTIIFVDSRAKTRDIMIMIRSWMARLSARYTPYVLMKIIRNYHRNTADRDKEQIYQAFAQDNSELRIVVATESLGLGVDLPNVDRVVLYGLPLLKDLDTIMQRFGRAARRSSRADGTEVQAQAILLYEYWAAVPTDMAPPTQLEADVDVDVDDIVAEEDDNACPFDDNGLLQVVFRSRALDDNDGRERILCKRRKSAFERRAGLPPVLRDIIDAQHHGRCQRKLILQYYEEHLTLESTRLPLPASRKCCSACNPALLPDFQVPGRGSSIKRLSAQKALVRADLERWCTLQAGAICGDVPWDAPVEVFLDKSSIKELALACDSIWSVDAIQPFIPDQWPYLSTYGQMMVDKIKEASNKHVVKARFDIATPRAYTPTSRRRSQLAQAASAPSPMQMEFSSLLASSASIRDRALTSARMVLQQNTYIQVRSTSAESTSPLSSSTKALADTADLSFADSRHAEGAGSIDNIPPSLLKSKSGESHGERGCLPNNPILQEVAVNVAIGVGKRPTRERVTPKRYRV